MTEESIQSKEGWGLGVVAALLAILVGIGLARFAYSPLIPVVIGAGWLTPGQAAYLGAGNLAGYLVGAWISRLLAARWPVQLLLRVAMLLASVSFLLSVVPSFSWLLGWRLVAGIAGGILMVLAAPLVLPNVPIPRRGRASGIIFAGVGFGIILSGTVVPLLAAASPETAWLALALLSGSATVLAWGWWPAPGPIEQAQGMSPADVRLRPRVVRRLRLLYLTYCLVAIGLVPHMVFLVDYVARGLGAGLAAGGRYWIVFGLGALVGPILAGRAADAIGYRGTLAIALLIQLLCVALPAATVSQPLLIFSSLVIGASVSGTVPLVLGRVHDIVVDSEARRAAWSTATICFAIGQAGAGYVYSLIFAATDGTYRPLFAVGATALATALAVALIPETNRFNPSDLARR